MSTARAPCDVRSPNAAAPAMLLIVLSASRFCLAFGPLESVQLACFREPLRQSSLTSVAPEPSLSDPWRSHVRRAEPQASPQKERAAVGHPDESRATLGHRRVKVRGDRRDEWVKEAGGKRSREPAEGENNEQHRSYVAGDGPVSLMNRDGLALVKGRTISHTDRKTGADIARRPFLDHASRRGAHHDPPN